jgi:hypothetical protein
MWSGTGRNHRAYNNFEWTGVKLNRR